MSKNTVPVLAEVIYTAPTGNRAAGRIHRAACKHIPKGAVRMTAAEAGADALLDATRATCCSVREADRNGAVNAARAAEMAAADGEAAAVVPAGGGAAVPGEAESGVAAAPEAANVPAAARMPAGTRSFDAAGITEHVCEGECGQVRPVRSFPTLGRGTRRGVECRTCRDRRVKAAKSAAGSTAEAA